MPQGISEEVDAVQNHSWLCNVCKHPQSTLQGCELDTVRGIKNILKSTIELKSLPRQDSFEWPIKLLLGRIKDEEVKSCTRELHLKTSAEQLKTN